MQLYNTITRTKEHFTPRHEGQVGMYVCGITAYDLCHIGHARSAVVFDVLARYLRHLGYHVRFIRNFTDVDDKIIKRANEMGISSQEVAERYIGTFYEDMDQLGVLRADVEPRATEHIPDMIHIIQALIDKGHAYPTASGDVYFRVRSFPDYGKLSWRNIEDLESGARVAPGEQKEDPLDFALWKASKPGEPFWDSPWGDGRPGWHIECSAMSGKYVDLPLDIHGGGQDLIFPHHENEIAQTEAAHEISFARYWVHNGFVQVNSEKMSKSLGNFNTIRDILENYLPETLRYFLLTRHYRSPIDFTFEAMDEAEKNLKRVYELRQLLNQELGRSKWTESPLPSEVDAELAHLIEAWTQAMDDDLNTAAAVGHVFGAIRLVGRILENAAWRKSMGAKAVYERLAKQILDWGSVLGVFQRDPDAFLNSMRSCRLRRKGIEAGDIEQLVQARQDARKAKDFTAADRLRDELAAKGVEVRDTPAGPAWDIL